MLYPIPTLRFFATLQNDNWGRLDSRSPIKSRFSKIMRDGDASLIRDKVRGNDKKKAGITMTP